MKIIVMLKWIVIAAAALAPINALMEPHASNGLPYAVNVGGLFVTTLVVIAAMYGLLYAVLWLSWKYWK